MPFYKFNWGSSEGGQLKNCIDDTEINTNEVTEYIKPDIKESDSNNEEINEEVLMLAIKHFIDTSFKKDNDLNKMGYDRSDEVGGEWAYNYAGIITDLATRNYMNIPNQRYIEQPSLGVEKTIPLSFYFDISGSMYKHTDFLARISFLLLQNGISILFGFNERINGMVLADEGIKTIEELNKILISNNHNSYISENESSNLAKFLTGRKAEKCVIFSDFDPYETICSLSHSCKTYWFCFEDRYNTPKYDFREYNGGVYYTNGFDSMKNHFINMDNYTYVEKQKKLILDITQRRKKNGRN